MNSLQIAILVLAILLILSTGFNIYAELPFSGWGIIISYVGNGINVVTSITLLIGVFRNLGKSFYKIPLIFLYVGDIISLFVFIVFIVIYILNYPKIINMVIITALIVIVHICLKKFGLVYANSQNAEQQQFLPINFQQSQSQTDYEPNISPS